MKRGEIYLSAISWTKYSRRRTRSSKNQLSYRKKSSSAVAQLLWITVAHLHQHLTKHLEPQHQTVVVVPQVPLSLASIQVAAVNLTDNNLKLSSVTNLLPPLKRCHSSREETLIKSRRQARTTQITPKLIWMLSPKSHPRSAAPKLRLTVVLAICVTHETRTRLSTWKKTWLLVTKSMTWSNESRQI